MTMKIFTFCYCFILCCTVLNCTSVQKANKQCADFQDNDRFDCYPEPGVNQAACEARGCCWAASDQQNNNVPGCFYPSDFPTYQVDRVNKTNRGITAYLTKSTRTFRPKDILKLRLEIVYETESRLRFKISDANSQRWEVPIPLGPPDQAPPVNVKYSVNITQHPFGISVIRKSDKLVLFDSISPKAPLLFADQFLQISTRLHVKNLYGIGENRKQFLIDLKKWYQLALWAKDSPPQPLWNSYGVHNFYLGLTNEGSAYGVFFLNGNAQEVVVQPLPALTYRTIGGVLDFFIFTGETPSDVIQQYTALIGNPMFPPYWTLGFHLSRYGYGSLNNTNKTLQRNLAAAMPLDTQWNDIDYMHNYRDWTFDPVRYADLPDYVDQLHTKYGMHYVMIVDPGISNKNPGSYSPYDTGLRSGIFINRSDGSGPLEGTVWPGTTVYPDFTNPSSLPWWKQCVESFHEKVKFDGLWTDMNEPSNFGDGSTSGCPSDQLNYPPYVPHLLGGTLMSRTICPSAKQYLSTHYNLHSMYGYYETKVTNEVMRKLYPNKRLFILTRSSFAGSGRYAFHWTGDNTATWDAMYISISEVMNFNLFGIPMAGVCVCGFGGDTTEELCTRWMQLASFHPFMWNHGDIGSREQDPAVWSQVAQNAMRKALQMRYSILPYMYTLFYRAHLNGTTVARPLFFEFPNDPATHAIDRQFLLGPSLLISPVLEKGARKLKAYIPDSTWCDMNSLTQMKQKKAFVTLDAPLDTINVHIRGGSILPLLPSARTTTESRKMTFSLLACLQNERASGELYWDDGESMDAVTNGQFNLIDFVASAGQLQSIPQRVSYKAEKMTLTGIALMGVAQKPKNVTVNGVAAHHFTFNGTSLLLNVTFVEDMTKPIAIKWTY